VLKLNVGSGQRHFDTTKGWVNCDINYSRVDQRPDIACDGARLPFPNDLCDILVLHHVLEHFGCGEGTGLVREGFRVLKSGGSLLVFVPDLHALAQRWLEGEISEQIYKTNLYGAYQGAEEDRHRWGFSEASLLREVSEAVPWRQVKLFDWCKIEGADIARAWWILGVEAVK